ncbi:MAG: diguanylate cyclase [Alphaproteobacteria bacterium]|nr:diguanylate cyclase [Alphaproteobacteria bacterium]
MDTVLIGGFAFLVSGAAVWLILSRLQSSEISDRNKRLLTYFLLGLLVVMVIIVMQWHAENFKQNYQSSHLLPLQQPIISLLG